VSTVGAESAGVARPGLAVTVATAGSVVLVARPLLLAHTSRPVELLVVVFSALLILGAFWPARSASVRPRRETVRWTTTVAVLATGLVAFGLGRVLGGGGPPAPTLGMAIALNTLAAVSEEAFFRRLVYESFLTSGPVPAVVASTALFAIVHVTVYGLWVLPLDLAAGLILSWQRWASGSWHVPALTHALANILVVI